MRALTRMWQMLLKALEEVAAAPNAMMAAEMAMIRLTHVADLPSPEELVRRLTEAPRRRRPRRRRPAAAAAGRGARGRRRRPAAAARPAPRRRRRPSPARWRATRRFEDVVALVRARRDMSLLVEIETGVRLVSYAPGPHRVRAGGGGGAGPRGAAGAAAAGLDRRALGRGGGRLRRGRDHRRGPRRATRATCARRALAHPLVQAVLAAFPGAEIRDVRPPGRAAPTAPAPPRRKRTTTGIRSIPLQRRS